jgi:Domain of Unknown Function (DUF1206)
MTTDLAYESKFQWMTRVGFAARGLLYIVIAVLVLQTGRTEDLTGAMEYVDRGAGHWLLIAMMAGMVAYGLWRVSDAATGMESGRGDAKAWRKRAAAGASGIIYLFLAYKAFEITRSGRAEGGGGPQENAADVLSQPNGELLLGAAAAVLVGAGLMQLYKAASCSFLHRLDERAQQPWAKWLGRIGYAARGVIFLIVGYMLAKATLAGSAAQAGGLEEALDALSGPVAVAVAAGLLLFGFYSILEARFRRIHRPPVERIEQEVRENVGA